MQLKDIVIDLLKESELDDPMIELDELPTGTVLGKVTSASFSGRSLSQNTKMIRDILKRSLPDSQLKKISELIPFTPDQQEVINEFEGEDGPPQD